MSCFCLVKIFIRHWQVEQTEELTAQTKSKISQVRSQAEAVTNGARGVAEASVLQLAALAKAKSMLPDCINASEKAVAAFRCCARAMASSRRLSFICFFGMASLFFGGEVLDVVGFVAGLGSCQDPLVRREFSIRCGCAGHVSRVSEVPQPHSLTQHARGSSNVVGFPAKTRRDE